MNMRIGWIGFHEEGLPALGAMLESGAPVVGVVTLTPSGGARRSGTADYSDICRAHGVPLHRFDDINGPEARAALEAMDLDLVYVIGWTQLVRAETLALARIGMIGAHASVLPHNRGRAPINWALIHGERETGNTLFWLDVGTDSGLIIDAVSIPITDYDTCATLYAKVAESNRDMIMRATERIMAGERPGRPQPESDEPLLPRRRPEDGRLDFSQPGRRVYDFVRALTRPYPGAFADLDGHRWKIWHAAQLELPDGDGAHPGEIRGRALSPLPEACGQIVSCGSGSVLLLEVEDETGRILKGPDLAEQDWTGRRFGVA